MVELWPLLAIDWLRPAWLALPLLALAVSWRRRRGGLALQLPGHLRTALQLAPLRSWRTRGDQLLRWLTVVLLCAALAGPVWRQQPLDDSLANTEMTLLVDLSPAALQRDVVPDRLSRGVYLVESLWRRAPALSSEIWAFAGSAHRALPMSRDSAISALYLRQLQPALMPDEGRNMAAIEALWGQPPATVVLLSGVLSGADRAALSRWVAAGSAVHLLWLNSQPLRDLPAGVSVYRGSDGEQAAQQLHRQLVREQWLRQPLQRDNYRDLSPSLVAAALLLLLLRSVLLALRQRRSVVQLCLAALLLVLFGGGWVAPAQAASEGSNSWSERVLAALLSPDQLGRYYFERQQYGRAASHFQHPQWSAVAYFYSGEYTLARQQFAALESASGWYHSALAAAHERRYDLALQAVERSLALQPQWSLAQQLRQQLLQLLQAMAVQSEQQQVEQWQRDSQQLALDERQINADSSGELAQWRNSNGLSAEQLAEQSVREAWLKQVSHGPEHFLQRKFLRQWRAQRERGDE